MGEEVEGWRGRGWSSVVDKDQAWRRNMNISGDQRSGKGTGAENPGSLKETPACAVQRKQDGNQGTQSHRHTESHSLECAGCRSFKEQRTHRHHHDTGITQSRMCRLQFF